MTPMEAHTRRGKKRSVSTTKRGAFEPAGARLEIGEFTRSFTTWMGARQSHLEDEKGANLVFAILLTDRMWCHPPLQR